MRKVTDEEEEGLVMGVDECTQRCRHTTASDLAVVTPEFLQDSRLLMLAIVAQIELQRYI